MRNINVDTTRSTLWSKINKLLGLFSTQCLLVGSILGWLFGWFYKGFLLVSPGYLITITDGLGHHFISHLEYISATFGACILFVFGQIVASWLYHNAPTEEQVMDERSKQFYIYKLPPWPQSKNLQFVVGESHKDDGGYIPDPSWATIPQLGLFGNIFVAGGIGTGKTNSCAYPFIEQIFQFHPQNQYLKPCGLILDEKGDFYKNVTDFAGKVGRQNDIIPIEVGGEYSWNPIHAPEIMVEVLAGRLLALYENLKGEEGSSGGQWVRDGMFKIIKHGMGLHRIASGYITIKDLNDLVANMSGEPKGPYNPVIETLEKYDKILASRPFVSDEEKQDYYYHREYFAKELAYENFQNKATYIGAVTSITDLFSKPTVAKTFCPPLNEIKLPSFESLVETGKIVVLNAPSSIYGSIGTAIGIMLKLEFQRTLLGRVSRETKDASLNKERSAFFLCDEYQNFVTVSGKTTNEGDDKFYAESRQSRCVSMVLTQSITSMTAKTGKTKADVILGSLRTKIFFAITLESDQKRAAEVCGKSMQFSKGQSFSENLANGSYNPIAQDVSASKSGLSSNMSFTERYEFNFQPSLFGNLKSFESISIIFNGVQLEPPKIIYHKTNFVPKVYEDKYTKRTIPYKLLIDEIARELKGE